MAATAVDSALLRGLFTTETMRGIWSDESRVQKQLDAEAALARAQARLGVIPAEAAEEIARHANVASIDLERLRVATERSGYPIVGLVEQLAANCRDGLGGHAHRGATTQDIVDTATVLQLRESLTLIETGLGKLADALAKLARDHRATPIAGRTNGQQAVPITFGFKMAVLLAAVDRHRERLVQLRGRVLVGQLGGAAGTLASLGDAALPVRDAYCAALGLAAPVIAWHTARDGIGEFGAFLALVGGTLGKLATDVRLMAQTEVGEVAEPAAQGRGVSTAMPHKRNPVACTYILAAVPVVRQHAALLLEAAVAEHERPVGPWQLEWIVLPEACCLLEGALAQAVRLAEGLVVDADAMRRNLDLTHGLVTSEAVATALAASLGREHAHERVAELARAAATRGRPLVDLLSDDPEIASCFDRAALERLCDPTRDLGSATAMVDRVLACRLPSLADDR